MEIGAYRPPTTRQVANTPQSSLLLDGAGSALETANDTPRAAPFGALSGVFHSPKPENPGPVPGHSP